MRPRVTPFSCDPDLDAGLGAPLFDASAWLLDLELRLGVAPPAVTREEREVAYARTARSALERDRSLFFARSFDADPIGTTAALLALRDSLVEAGWTGASLDAAGPRARAIAELEVDAPLEVRTGSEDRVARVATLLERTRGRPYDAIELCEDEALWAEVWRRLIRALRAAGTGVEHRPHDAIPAAPEGSDLARVQRRIAAGSTAHAEAAPVAREAPLSGDGSLVLLGARTSWELGDMVAAFLAGSPERDALVVRLGDARPLDAALERRGEPTMGTRAASAERASLQVLPLAMSMLFAPRDPRRALALAELSDGPFTGRVGRALAEALGASPSVGSRAWADGKARLRAGRDGVPSSSEAREAERRERAIDRVEAWFEGPAFGRDGAPKDAVIAAAQRVGAWAARRSIVRDPRRWQRLASEAAHLAASAADHAAPTLSAAALERIAARAIAAAQHAATREQAGRIDHTSSPSGVTRPHDLALVWSAGSRSGGAAGHPNPWRARERAALEAIGLRFTSDEATAHADARAWRRVLLSARSTFVLASPETHLGEPQPSLPLLDEIVARAAIDGASQRRITASARDVLDRASPCHRLRVDVARSFAPLDLPAPRAEWTVDAARLAARIASVTTLSPTRTEPMLACPLRWVFESALRILAGRRHAVIEDERLPGRLGHRLVEELFAAGILADPRRVKDLAPTVCDALLEREGGPLLLPGRTTARAHVRARLVRASSSLARFLHENDLEPRAVELESRARHGARELAGRLDLICVGRTSGDEVIVDVKWGDAKYRDALADGLAVQLAMYAETRRREVRALSPDGPARAPRALYFSIKSAGALTLSADGFADARRVNGIALFETWSRVERTIDVVFARLADGRIPASAAASTNARATALHGFVAPRLLDPLAASGCEHCAHRVLCGRAWRTA